MPNEGVRHKLLNNTNRLLRPSSSQLHPSEAKHANLVFNPPNQGYNRMKSLRLLCENLVEGRSSDDLVNLKLCVIAELWLNA